MQRAWLGTLAGALVAVAGCTEAHIASAPDADGASDAGVDATLRDAFVADTPAPDAPTALDAANDGSGSPLCDSASDCSDGVWCNGPEGCAPLSPSADERGCTPALAPPCPPGFVCAEVGTRCLDVCDIDGDLDGDGHRTPECWGGDCDDGNAEIHPLAIDQGCNGVDDDCDGRLDEGPPTEWWVDGDGDGVGSVGSGAPSLSCEPVPGHALSSDDCNDFEATVFPGAVELCDGLDNDCVAATMGPGEDDDGDWHRDAACGGRDCDDDDPRIPGSEVWCNGIDENCDGRLLEDDDGDGELTPLCGGHDCDDRDPAIGEADGDQDLDGHLAGRCGGDDCDDARASRFRGAVEICDRIDNDCSQSSWLDRAEDEDEDGFAPVGLACRDDVAGAFPRRDCLDTAADVAPGVPDVCNGVDDDCDPATPDGSAVPSGCLAGHVCMDGACRQTIAVESARDRTCALLSNGEVRCWGASDYPWLTCPLPDEDGGCWRPSPVPGWTDVIALGSDLDCAVRTGGAVVGWGGDAWPTGTPAAVLCGASCLARADDRGLWCQGVGDVAGASDVVRIDADSTHACALTLAGEVWCWGANRHGEVGDGTTTWATSPVRVGLSDVLDVAVAPSATCAVRADGSVWCWGQNTGGALGTIDGASAVLTPSLVPSVAGARAITGGGDAWSTSFVAERSAADALAFGCASYTCLGTADARPGTVPRTADLTNVVMGFRQACGLTPDGRVACWGGDRRGLLGWPYAGAPSGRVQPLTVGGL